MNGTGLTFKLSYKLDSIEKVALSPVPDDPNSSLRLRALKPQTLNPKTPQQEYSGLGKIDIGDCQNYSPFLDPYYNTGPNI